MVAPTLISTRASDKIKTDRRDSLCLAELLRAGELTAVWVPDEAQEAMRDLVRARADFKTLQRQLRQRLLGFLLRHSLKWTGGKSNWTKGFWAWLEGLRLPSAHQQYVLEEYAEAVRRCDARIVDALMAMRGISLVTEMGIAAELGDLSRFDKATEIMAYLGLVPSEHSSGNKRRRGGITKTGNAHVRRLLIEAAWCYRFTPRKSGPIKQRARRIPPPLRLNWRKPSTFLIHPFGGSTMPLRRR